jgi:iron(II)-dependent oxidoreductase
MMNYKRKNLAAMRRRVINIGMCHNHRNNVDLFLRFLFTFLIFFLLWHQNIFAQEGNQYSPHWSPDGEKYAYLEERNLVEYSIKIRSVSGETIADLGDIVQQILAEQKDKEYEEEGPPSLVTGLYYFDWAPDSQRYVFSFLESEGIFLSRDLFGTDVIRLSRSSPEADTAPRWSPNGEYIVFVRGKQLHLLHSTSQFRNRNEKLEPKPIPLEGLEKAMSPNWSPDGAKIAFSGFHSGDFDIYIFDLNTKERKCIIQTKDVSEYNPVWSPDGKWLAFYSKRKEEGQFNLAIAPSDAENLSQYQVGKQIDGVFLGAILLATGVQKSDLLGPSWLPSSRQIIYVKNDEKNHHPIEVVEFDFSDPKQQTVHVLNPKRLDTDTKLNADVQCTRSGSPKLAFHCFSQADGLPLKKIQLYVFPQGEFGQVEEPIQKTKVIPSLTPKELTLNIEVLQPDGQAPIEGIRVELKETNILKTTNSSGIAQFTVKASLAPVTIVIVIHPTDIYQGEEFKLTFSSQQVQLLKSYDNKVNVENRGQIWYATVKLQEKPKEVKVVLKDKEGNRLNKVMEVEIGQTGTKFDTNGELYIPENLLGNTKVTLKYEGYEYSGHLLRENDNYAIKLEKEIPFLNLNVRVENIHGQQIRQFTLNGEEKTAPIGKYVPLRLLGLYGETQELNIGSGNYRTIFSIVLIPNSQGETSYQIESNYRQMFIKDDDKHLTVKLLIDWLVETLKVIPPEPNLEIFLNRELIGTTDGSGEVQPLFLEKKQSQLNNLLIKKDGVDKKPIRLKLEPNNSAIIYLELPPNEQESPRLKPDAKAALESAKSPSPKIVGKDGAPMVLIPGGQFKMASDDEKLVNLRAFYMDVYEVTNAQYKKFIDATGHPTPQYWNNSRYNAPNQPVVGVSWYDADAYAQWAGKRLPTEVQWEKAARGGLVGKVYPWGDNWDSSKANNKSMAMPVGSFPPNGYGLYDMAGNAWEWCADQYDTRRYYQYGRQELMRTTKKSSFYVIRGGSWGESPALLGVTSRGRNASMKGRPNIGFRCVADVIP